MVEEIVPSEGGHISIEPLDPHYGVLHPECNVENLSLYYLLLLNDGCAEDLHLLKTEGADP